jgi:hypothetical protein
MSGYALPKSRSGSKTAVDSIDHVPAFTDAYDDTPKLTKISASIVQADEEVTSSLATRVTYPFAIVWREFHRSNNPFTSSMEPTALSNITAV